MRILRDWYIDSFYTEVKEKACNRISFFTLTFSYWCFCNHWDPWILVWHLFYTISGAIFMLFFPLHYSTVKACLDLLVNWLHKYIDNQDTGANAYCDVALHGPFYSTCQTVFYTLIFRHKQLLDGNLRKGAYIPFWRHCDSLTVDVFCNGQFSQVSGGRFMLCSR